jgi:hypothetical protein
MPDSRWFRQTILRLRTLFQRNRVERELEEEFNFTSNSASISKSREVCPQKKLGIPSRDGWGRIVQGTMSRYATGQLYR